MASHRYLAARLLAATLVLLGLSGCATLSEEECLTGDWHAIGYEDGLAGQPATRVAKHREACAKHGQSIDLAAYNAGRDEGLEVYCRPDNGYRVGLSGASYKGVCPTHLADEFVFAYNYGRDIHSLRSSVRSEQRAIDQLHADYHAIDDEILQQETLLVSPELTPQQRVETLAMLKHLVQEKQDIEADLDYRQQRLDGLQEQLYDLETRSPF